MGATRGFTLIELAIVVALIGLITGGGFATYRVISDNNRASETVATLKALENDLMAFAAREGRLPSDLASAWLDRNDGWGNPIRYYVGGNFDSGSPFTCPEAGTLWSVPPGATPVDLRVTRVGPTAEEIVFVIASTGRDGVNQHEGPDFLTSDGPASETLGAFDDFVRARGFTDILRAMGCRQQIARASAFVGCDDASDPICVCDTPDSPHYAPDPQISPMCALCARNPGHPDCECDAAGAFAGGLSATGEKGEIKIDRHSNLSNLPTGTLPTVKLSGAGASPYTASGTPGSRLEIPMAPPNPSNADLSVPNHGFLAITASTARKSVTTRNHSKLRLEGPAGGGSRLVLNVGGGKVEIQSHSTLEIVGHVTIYAKDFEVKEHGTIDIINGSLTIILSGKFEVKSHANMNQGKSTANLLVLAQGDVEFKEHANAAGYFYSEGDMEIKSHATVRGSIVAENIEFKNHANFTYSDAAPGSLDDLCP